MEGSLEHGTLEGSLEQGTFMTLKGSLGQGALEGSLGQGALEGSYRKVSRISSWLSGSMVLKIHATKYGFNDICWL